MAEPEWLVLQKRIFGRFVQQRLKQGGIKVEIKDLLEQLKDGQLLLQLLEVLSGHKYSGKPIKPSTQRIVQINNVNTILNFIKSLKVDMKNCSAENIVEGNPQAVFGLLFSIILKFMKLDDDDEAGGDVREALKLWFNRKVNSYGIEVKGFKGDFHDGRVFCALIHKMRPKLLDFQSLKAGKANGPANLKLALDLGEEYCNVEKYLQPSDIPKLDEISMTIYCFDWYDGIVLLQKQDVAARRIGKLIKMTQLHDKLRADYTNGAQALLQWIDAKSGELAAISFDNTLAGIKSRLDNFYSYKKGEKSAKIGEHLEVNAIYNNLAARLVHNKRPPFNPTGLMPADLDSKMDGLEKVEIETSVRMHAELTRQLELDKLQKRFHADAARLTEWLNTEDAYAATAEVSKLTDEAKEKLDAHLLHEKDTSNMKSTRLADLKELQQKLSTENYEKKGEVEAAQQGLEGRFASLEQALSSKRSALQQDLAREQAADAAACETYAGLVNEFNSWNKQRKDALVNLSGELDAQLANVQAQIGDTSPGEQKLAAIRGAQEHIDSRQIISNPKSNTQVADVEAANAQFALLLQKKKELIEHQLEEKKRAGLSPEQVKEINDNFAYFDADKSGYLNKKELRSCLQSLGENATPADVDRVFAEYDTDKSGKISAAEFEKLMKKQLGDTNTKEEIQAGWMCISLDKPNVTKKQLDILVNGVSWTDAHVAYLESEQKDVPFSNDESEYFLADFSAIYIPPLAGVDAAGSTARVGVEQERVRRRQRGRLKLCSGSLMFDPEDVANAIVRLPFQQVGALGQYERGALLSALRSVEDGSQWKDVIAIRTSAHVFMKENGKNVPYRFESVEAQHYFALRYASGKQLLAQIGVLLDITRKGSPAERERLFQELLDEKERVTQFDRSLLRDFKEPILMEQRCERVTPLVHEPGRCVLSGERVYFAPFNNVHAEPVHIIELPDVLRVVKRRYTLRHIAVELYTGGERCTFLSFPRTKERNEFVTKLLAQPTLRSLEADDAHNMTLKWQHGLVSNFEYILFLNHSADRTVNDLTQYPVFPWIIADYESEHLDLASPATYRDLSKPIGALNDDRLRVFRERYEQMPADEPRFLYGTHYSTPGYVLYYMVRAAPEYMLRLQNGRFDAPDRLFHSIAETWRGCLTNPTDLKELTPEFFDLSPPNGSPGEFLVNGEHLDLGVRQSDGARVNDVLLPPWAKSAHDFVAKNRQALESECVSAQLHNWIDLIFGHKQRGDEALRANNLFYHMTYEDAVDIEAIDDPVQRHSIEMQIREFGQTPKQLFTTPHPRRLPAEQRRPQSLGDGSSKHVPLFASILDELDELDDKPSGDAAAKGGGEHSDGRRAGGARGPKGAFGDDGDEGGGGVDGRASETVWKAMARLQPVGTERIHKETIVSMNLSGDGDTLYTTSTDTTLRVYSLPQSKQVRNVSVCDMTISDISVLDDQGHILCAAWDNNVYLYSTAFGRVTDHIVAHDDAVSCLAVSDASDSFVTGSWDTTVKHWRIRPGQIERVPVHEYHELDDEVRSVCISASDPNTVFVGALDGSVLQLDLRAKERQRLLQPHVDAVTALSSDARQLVTASLDQHFKLIDVRGGTEVFSRDCETPLRDLLTDHSSTVLLGGEHGTLRLYSLRDGELTADVGAALDAQQRGADITRLVMSEKKNDATVVLSGSSDGTVRVWHAGAK